MRVYRAMSMDYAQMTEGCRHRRPAAQRALYDEFAPIVLGVCCRYASCRDEANDLMQDSMVKVYEKIGTLRNPDKLGSWIYNLTVNTCVQYCRSRSRVTLVDDMEGYSESTVELPYSEADIVAALEALTDSQRLAFNLCCVEEMNFAEVAERMRCTESNVRVLLFHARRNLRKRLEKTKQK